MENALETILEDIKELRRLVTSDEHARKLADNFMEKPEQLSEPEKELFNKAVTYLYESGLVAQLDKRIRRVLYRTGESEQLEVADKIQGDLLRCLIKPSTDIEDPESMNGYLGQMTRLRPLDAYRRSGAEGKYKGMDFSDPETERRFRGEGYAAGGQHHRVSLESLQEMYDKALENGHIPKNVAALFEPRITGQTLQEYAHEQGVVLSTVKVRAFRARLTLATDPDFQAMYETTLGDEAPDASGANSPSWVKRTGEGRGGSGLPDL